jgi:hypothetical protein
MDDFYRPQPMGANGAYRVAGIHIFGFLGTIAGTITVTAADGTVLLNAMPVTTGINWLQILLPSSEGADVQLAGGAAGSLLI